MVMVVVKCNSLGIFLIKNLKFLIRMAMSVNNVSDIGLWFDICFSFHSFLQNNFYWQIFFS